MPSLSLLGKIAKLNKQINRMAKAPSNKWTKAMMDLQTESKDSFGVTMSNNGVIQFSSKGLNSVQKDVLESMVDERLEKGSYSLKRENEKRKAFAERAGEEGVDTVKGGAGNSDLIFNSYEEERNFFEYLQETLELVDFFYDPEGSRDFIYNAYEEHLTPSEVATALRHGLHEPERVEPPEGGEETYSLF